MGTRGAQALILAFLEVRSSHRAHPYAIQYPINCCGHDPVPSTAHTRRPPLEDETADRSPIGKLYELNGYVDHWSNTSLHLAEKCANYPGKNTLKTGSTILVGG